jgi:hypothetical protein
LFHIFVTGVQIRAKAASGIGDTIAIGRVMYYGNIPFMPAVKTWVPAAVNPTAYTVIPFGEFHIFIGWTGQEAGFDSNNNLPAPSAEIKMQAGSGSTLSAEAA